MSALYRVRTSVAGAEVEAFGDTIAAADAAMLNGIKQAIANDRFPASFEEDLCKGWQYDRVRDGCAYDVSDDFDLIARLEPVSAPVDREPEHVPRFRHSPLTAAEFAAQLAGIDMAPAEFSRLTGVRDRTLAKWLAPASDGPPYWVRMVLAFMASSQARQFAHKIADRHLMSEDEYQQARDAAE